MREHDKLLSGKDNEAETSFNALYVGPSTLKAARPEIPSSKYYTLRYLLAATLADGESRILFPAQSADSEALFRGCRAFGAQLRWDDAEHSALYVQGAGRYTSEGYRLFGSGSERLTVNVGNAGAVLRLLLGPATLLPEVTFVTDHPQSLGKRPNRELLTALESLGAHCVGNGPEGYLPIHLSGGAMHGGSVQISGARSSQYLSALLFLAPLLPEGLEITVVDGLKSQPLILATLEVMALSGITVEHDDSLLYYRIPAGQRYLPGSYVVPGDYPSAAALLAAYATSSSTESVVELERLRPSDEIGDVLKETLWSLGADLQVEDEIVTLRGGQRLHGIRCDGDALIDCIPVLVACACFAAGESVFYNVESLHYKESDRINDLCLELRKAGCDVEPQRSSIVVHGHPEGIAGGAVVDGHSDHRLLMALAVVAMHSQQGLTLTGIEHIAKSYPDFFAVLQRCGAEVRPVRLPA